MRARGDVATHARLTSGSLAAIGDIWRVPVLRSVAGTDRPSGDVSGEKSDSHVIFDVLEDFSVLGTVLSSGVSCNMLDRIVL